MYSFKNNIKTELATNFTESTTYLACAHLITSDVAADRAAAWPDLTNGNTFKLSLTDTKTLACEIVECYSIHANDATSIVFRVRRAQENTSALDFAKSSTTVEHRLTAGNLDSFIQDTEVATTALSGIVKLDAETPDGSNKVAPGGFGLGHTVTRRVSNLDSVLETSFFCFDNTAEGLPMSFSGFGFTISYNSSNKLQVIFSYNQKSRMFIRVRSTTEWLAWEERPNGITDDTNFASSTTAASATAVKTIADQMTYAIGSIIPSFATSTYVPNGCVPVDGAEYTMAQFPTFYTNYLVAGKVSTCTYAQFAAQVTETGNCAKFALDTTNKKFKVPLLKDGDSITNASSSAKIGKSNQAGLPELRAQFNSPRLDNAQGAMRISNGGAAYSWQTVPDNTPTVGSTIQFVSSYFNPIYGRSSTVTTENISIRYFVVLANTQNTSSVFDWSNYMAALSGKSNVALDNISEDGKQNIAHFGMPSNTRKVTIAIPATGSKLLAPADGFFVFTGEATAPNQGCSFNDPLSTRSIVAYANQVAQIYIPVSSGATPRLNYDTLGTKTLTFIYAEGAQ